jgi:transcriptional regulator with XRE-family HTH domain
MLERGTQNLTLAKLVEIAQVLGTTFDSLVQKPRKRSLVVKKGRPKGS